MYIIIWKYRVDPEYRERFRAAYGRDGRWAQYFRRDDHYLSTELFEDTEGENIFLTVDMWKSRPSYEAFLDSNAEEYGRIDRECEELTLSEVKVGELHIDPRGEASS